MSTAQSGPIAGDVLITGATGVIGAAIARKLGEQGAPLHLCGRSPARLAALGLRATGLYEANLNDVDRAREVIEEFFETARRPYALICNAGNLGLPGRFHSLNFDEWRLSLDSNFFAHAAMIHEFLRLFELRGMRDGRIIVMSGAGLGGSRSFENVSSYSTAKAALTHLAEAIAPEAAALGVTINAVAPGAVVSGMTAAAIAAGTQTLGHYAEDAIKQRESGGVPPTLAADLISLLLSAEGAAISGRLLAARFDREKLAAHPHVVAMDRDLYRLRRIDEALFGRKS